jgi:hypothetical protein
MNSPSTTTGGRVRVHFSKSFGRDDEWAKFDNSTTSHSLLESFGLSSATSVLYFDGAIVNADSLLAEYVRDKEVVTISPKSNREGVLSSNNNNVNTYNDNNSNDFDNNDRVGRDDNERQSLLGDNHVVHSVSDVVTPIQKSWIVFGVLFFAITTATLGLLNGFEIWNIHAFLFSNSRFGEAPYSLALYYSIIAAISVGLLNSLARLREQHVAAKLLITLCIFVVLDIISGSA